MPTRLDHTIFNERAECQDKIIHLLEKMGYEYVSRSDAEKKQKKLLRSLPRQHHINRPNQNLNIQQN